MISSAILAEAGRHRMREAGNHSRRCYVKGVLSMAMSSQRS